MGLWGELLDQLLHQSQLMLMGDGCTAQWLYAKIPETR